MPELVCFRLAAWDTPLWALPNSRAGRYNHAGQGSTQYLALHPLTPWAEMARNTHRSSEVLIAELRLPLWILRITLVEDPLELDFNTAPTWGLSPEDVVADDHSPCRAFADRLRNDPDAPKTFVAPSAALPGTRNLVILEPRVSFPYQAEPIDEGDVPLSLAAEEAVAPQGLASMLHLINAGQDQQGLEAWRAGNEFMFRQPPTDHLGR
jgi:hypothetical protein